MTADWNSMPLADACSSIDYGLTASASPRPVGPKFLRITDIVHGQIDWEQVPFVDRLLSRDRFALKDGDIVIARTGATTGVSGYIQGDVDAVFASYLVRLRAKPRHYSRFLYYITKTPQYQQHIYTVAFDKGAQPNASAKALTSPVFSFPPLSEQRTIAGVLGALDDKIELNRRMNATLEAMARALFRSWFVDFDPVRAKAAGDAPAHMDAATAALFPDRFGEDGLPEGWRRLPLREAAAILSGGTPSKQASHLWGGTIPWISPKVMNEIHVTDAEDRVTAEAVGNGTRLAPANSTLVMVRGMGLHQGVRISQAQRDVTFNQDVKALVPKKVPATFLLYGLLDWSDFLFASVESSGHGTGRLPSEKLDEVTFVLPEKRRLATLMEPLERLTGWIEEERRGREQRGQQYEYRQQRR